MSGSHQKVTLAIDLGARFTGVFLVSHPEGQLPTAADAKAMTLVMPKDADGIMYSMKARTAARHRMRGYKRFKMARRLLDLAVEHKVKAAGVVFTDDEKKRQTQALRGLLKRRGYSRAEAEVDISVLEKVDVLPFAQHEELKACFNDVENLAVQWENLSQDFGKVEALEKALEKVGDKNQFKAYVKEFLGPDGKSVIQDYGAAYSTLKQAVDSLIQAKHFGQRPRKDYLDEIQRDIKRDTRLVKLTGVFGGADNLWRLVGNISNLQLRAQRWYFNNPDMLNADLFDPKRLQKTLVRAFKYFHAKDDQSKDLQKLISEIEQAPDVIDCLCSIDPVRTIPVYEDQNNRRPPADQTLWLNPAALTARYGENWKLWARYLNERDPALSDGLDEILECADRRSRVPALGGVNPADKTEYRLSYILQRALDRSKSRDKLCLRQIAAKGEVPDALKATLESVIGSQHIPAFVDLLMRYYDEVNTAKQGFWRPLAGGLLERADIHPPMKRKVLPMLLGNLMGGDDALGQALLDLWKTNGKVKGSSTLRSLCYGLEKARKDEGNGFKNGFYQIFSELQTSGKDGIWSALAEGLKTRKSKEKNDYWRYIQNTVSVVDYLKQHLALTADQVRRITNPFTLAQFYNLIETTAVQNKFQYGELYGH